MAAATWLLPWARIRWRHALMPVFAIILPGLVIVGGFASYNQYRFGYFGVTPFMGIALCNKTTVFIDRLPANLGQVRAVLIEFRNNDLVAGKSHTGTQ